MVAQRYSNILNSLAYDFWLLCIWVLICLCVWTIALFKGCSCFPPFTYIFVVGLPAYIFTLLSIVKSWYVLTYSLPLKCLLLDVPQGNREHGSCASCVRQKFLLTSVKDHFLDWSCFALNCPYARCYHCSVISSICLEVAVLKAILSGNE